MPDVFVIIPLKPEFEDVYSAITTAARKASDESGVEFKVTRGEEDVTLKPVFKKIDNRAAQSDIIVVDTSGQHPSTMYQLGYVHALKKPTIFVEQTGSGISFDFFITRVIVYDRKQLHRQLVVKLAETLNEVACF